MALRGSSVLPRTMHGALCVLLECAHMALKSQLFEIFVIVRWVVVEILITWLG